MTEETLWVEDDLRGGKLTTPLGLTQYVPSTLNTQLRAVFDEVTSDATARYIIQMSIHSRTGIAAAAIVLLVAGCGPLREAAEQLLDRRTPRERYQASLVNAGLDKTALAIDWTAAADRALRDAPRVPATHLEAGFFSPAEPVALAFRVNLKRGQKLSFEIALPGDTSAHLFVEAFQVDPEQEVAHRRVAAADSGERSITFGPRRDGEFIVLAQPELLRGGRFSATLRVLPTLAFPVHNRREGDIKSRFGDARDGGQRSHHGVDIFAPRGTPVLAAAPGTVSRVQTTPVGGNVVWMRDTSGNRLYYAHLDSQSVSSGDDVMVGDTLGFVGNTGNARTTPPHLHFGVYSRGPVDPWWFLHKPVAALPVLTADTSLLGKMARTTRDETVLRAAPDAEADSVLVLVKQTALRIVAATGRWYRVNLPDGASGYLRADATEAAARALHSSEAAEASVVLSRPVAQTAPGNVLAVVAEGEHVEVLGRFGGFALVRNAGISGWLPLPEKQPPNR